MRAGAAPAVRIGNSADRRRPPKAVVLRCRMRRRRSGTSGLANRRSCRRLFRAPRRRPAMGEVAAPAVRPTRQRRWWLRIFLIGLVLWLATVAVIFLTGNVNL